MPCYENRRLFIYRLDLHKPEGQEIFHVVELQKYKLIEWDNFTNKELSETLMDPIGGDFQKPDLFLSTLRAWRVHT